MVVAGLVLWILLSTSLSDLLWGANVHVCGHRIGIRCVYELLASARGSSVLWSF